MVKTPKLYFCDPGLLVYLLGFSDWPAVMKNAAWGAVWENLVISEVRKHFLNKGKRPPCWFWRESQGDEVDLLVEVRPRQFLALECKAAAQVDAGALRGAASVVKAFGPESVKRGAVVCRTEGAYPLAEKGRLVAIPLGGGAGLHAFLTRNA